MILSLPPNAISIWSSVSAVIVVSASASKVKTPPFRSTAPVTPPVAVIAPVAVKTPLILALPITVKALYAEVVPNQH